MRAKRVGDFAETEVEHVFKNDSDRNLEGTFRFPVPDGAILIGFAMEVNDQLMEGELVEAEKARKTFETIVDSMQDPALLEWEQGNVFKLRVFPIEAKKNKKVVLRFAAPLHRDADGWQFVYPTAAAEMQAKIGRFQLDFEGKSVIDEKAFAPGREIVVPVTGAMPAAFRETRADATYTTVRVRPDWSKMPAPPSTRNPRRVIAVIDTSRSSLEDRALELDTLSMILGELRPEDRFMTVAADVSVRPSGEFVEANAAGIAAAVAFVKSNEPDGASDLAAAMKFAGGLAAKAKERHDGGLPEVVYIGDGTATWGETEPKALENIATASLTDVPFHAVILGKNADLDGMRAIAAALGGEVVRPRTALDAKRFALMLGHLPELRRLTHARLAAQAKDVLFPARETTMIEGDEIVAVVKTPTGEALPSLLSFDAKLGGADYHEDIKVDAVHASTPRVAQRWAREQIAMLERGGDKEKLAVVKLSLDFGVMSQYTSFLVLESEEAYAKYDIERRQAKRLQAEAQKSAADPHVSGADLESVQARTAHLDPDHLQPGDPEIHIPAPPDAQSVVVDLPFGESKIATYEAGQTNAWTVRFLIDKETPDGTYDVVVRITHKDGALEILHLSYVVDTKKPSVDLSVRPAPRQPGTLEIRASQVITQAEITGAMPRAQGTIEQMRK
ncbi:MAG: VIT domain-containing protein, partial [Polyangiaceae bacterium]